MRLILASASPRRAELLEAAGIPFTVEPADVDETAHPDEPPRDYVVRVARLKAHAVASRRGRDAPILAADTTVVTGGRMLGKPSGAADARGMLRALSGTVHDVHTGMALVDHGGEATDVVTTRVWFSCLSDEEIEWYVRTGEPEGKAGAYAIQGRGSRFVERIDGSWANVVGLPVAVLYRLLQRAGHDILT